MRCAASTPADEVGVMKIRRLPGTVSGFTIKHDSDLPSLVLLDILYEIVVAGQIFSVNKVYSQASLQYYNNSTTVCNPEIEALDFGLSWLSLFLFLRLQQLPFQFTCRRHLVKKSTA